MNPRDKERQWYKDSKKTSEYYGEVVYIIQFIGPTSTPADGWRYDAIWLSPTDDTREEFFAAVQLSFSAYRPYKANREDCRRAVRALFEEKE